VSWIEVVAAILLVGGSVLVFRTLLEWDLVEPSDEVGRSRRAEAEQERRAA
jgi:hypothetical protein